MSETERLASDERAAEIMYGAELVFAQAIQSVASMCERDHTREARKFIGAAIRKYDAMAAEFGEAAERARAASLPF